MANQLSGSSYSGSTVHINLFLSTMMKQEAHGPRVAHLSDIATANMQMICNIFPILSSQLMKRSSFNQFLLLKERYIRYDSQWTMIIWTNSQSHFNSRINVKLAKWFLKNHDFIHVNSTVAGKYNKHKQDGSHLGFSIRMIFSYCWSTSHLDTFNELWVNCPFGSGEKVQNRFLRWPQRPQFGISYRND